MKQKILGLTATAVVGSSLFASAAAAESVVVKSGDTLWSLSRQYDTSVGLIKNANGLSNDFLKIGQVLELPNTNSQIPKSNQQTASTVTPKVSTTTTKAVTYVVKSGDSLWVIARATNTTVSELKKLNGLKNDLIRVGQKLIVKQATTTTTKETETIPVTTPVSSKPSQAESSYSVKAGDSLWKIANQFNITVAELKVSNKLTSDVIRVGQVLKISGETSIPEAPKNTVETKPTSKVDTMINEAKALIGTPYVWAGNTPLGFDCSGYIYYVLNKVTSVSRLSTAGYWGIMKPVAAPSIGDFVFFTTYKEGPSHMGIYLGNNEFIHSSSSGVTISSLTNTYWQKRYLGAKRFS
ncbi:LysM peptidoglycan-binding domain-containing protein [Metabacillus litoralis]|uniref:LysM peptidoglycan-binding domain-containing protein n=1 Tax=Metabacillus litoralis TaxID=152268 RepID=A0A5C6W5B5_9BACI|nr:peptidoglycan endopeptidase [Metabacillus litoralis]TXC93146.1 LysM peptidoglycan-binding domain-containing protein [Metabacillus litoralis]